MESHVADDEGEPRTQRDQRSRQISLLFIFSLIFLLACSRTSNQFRKSAYNIGDSLKAAAKTLPPTPAVVKKVKPKKKKIYLTFDDGPNKGTQNVLDIAQQENIPVTFFIVGEHVFASKEQAMTWDSLQNAENIEICNHSYTHAHNKYTRYYENPDSVVKDIAKTKESLQLENNIVRAPGRNSWRLDSIQYTDIKKSKAALDSLEKAGFVVMGWDLEWHYDPKTLTVLNTADELLSQVDSVFNNNKTKTPDNLVLLAHDQVYKSSSDSLQLRTFVQKLKLKDTYEISLVSSYPGVIRFLSDSANKQ